MTGAFSLVGLIAILVAMVIGLGAGLRRHRDAEALLLQLRVLDALLSDGALSEFAVALKVRHLGRWRSRSVFEITGAVPTAAHQDRATALARRIACHGKRRIQVLDRMVVEAVCTGWPRVLLAEDAEDSRRGLQALLTHWGYQVETATDGELALQKARSLHPSVVITDVLMPRLNGLELLAALRREQFAIPVIVLTGQGVAGALGQALRPDLDDYIEKPVDVGHLRRALARALEGRTGDRRALKEKTSQPP